MGKKRDRKDLLLYGVAIVECICLGMATFLAIASGPFIRTTLRAQTARDQMTDELPSSIVVIKESNSTVTPAKTEEIATVSVIATSVYSLLQFIGILILFSGLYLRNHRFLLSFFGWCLISNVIILGSFIFGIVKISEARKEPLPEPPRFGIKVPPISDFISPFFQSDGPSPLDFLQNMFGGNSNQGGDSSDSETPNRNPQADESIPGANRQSGGSLDPNDFLSKFIAPFLKPDNPKQRNSSGGNNSNSNPLLNLFNALAGSDNSGSGSNQGRQRRKRSDPDLPPGAPPIPPTPALPFSPPIDRGKTKRDETISSGNGFFPSALGDLLPKEGAVIPLPAMELPPVIRDYIHHSYDDIFYFLICFTVMKALASIYSLVASLVCAVEFRHRERSISDTDFELKHAFGSKY